MSQDLPLGDDLSRLGLAVSDPARPAVPGTAPTEVGAPPRFDFRDFQRLSPQQMDRIRERHEAAMPPLGAVLSSFLRGTIEASLEGADPQSSPPLPGAGKATVYQPLLRCDDGSPVGFMTAGSDLVSLFLDLLFGGSGKHGLPLARPLTEIEKPLLHSVFQCVLGELAACWQDLGVGAIHLEAGGGNAAPQNPCTGPAVAIKLNLKLQDTSYPLRIVLLADAFPEEGAAAERKPSQPRERLQTATLLLSRLEKSPVRMEACLSGLSISVLDLLALRLGDILVFDCPRTQPAELLINGSLRFLGSMVPCQGRKGFQIEKAVKHSANAGSAPAGS